MTSEVNKETIVRMLNRLSERCTRLEKSAAEVPPRTDVQKMLGCTGAIQFGIYLGIGFCLAPIVLALISWFVLLLIWGGGLWVA